MANSKLETQRMTLREYPVGDAPTFHPSLDEFKDPLAYIESIRAEVRAAPLAADPPLTRPRPF